MGLQSTTLVAGRGGPALHKQMILLLLKEVRRET